MKSENEEGRNEAQTRLDVAARAAGIGVWEFEPRSGRLNWDSRCRELFGLSSSREVDYQTFLDGLHPDDRERADSAVQRALDPDGSGSYEIAYRTIGIDDKRLRHLAATGRNFFEEQEGKRIAVRFIGAVVDLSAIVEAQDAVRRSETQYRLVLEATNDAVWNWDLANDDVEWNDALYSAFGHRQAEVEATGVWWLNQIHPDDRARVDRDIHSVIDGSGNEWEAEYRFRRGDGGYATVYDRGSVIRDELGQAVRMIGAMLDVSKSREAEEKLAESEKRYRVLTEVSPQIVWMANADGELTYANRQWFDFTGQPRDNSAETGLKEALHPNDILSLREAWQAGSRSKSEWSVEVRFRSGSDDSWHWHLVRGRPVIGKDGEVDSWTGVAVNIHDRHEANEALIAEKARLETLRRVGSDLSAELELETLVQKVTDAGVELIGAKFGAFFYNVEDGAGEQYLLYTLSGADRADFEKLGRPRITEIFRPTFSGEGTIRSDDVTKDERYGRNAPHNGMPKDHLPVRSYLAVPVIGRQGEVIGALLFGHPEPSRFTQQHERLVTGIAAHAAIAIDNARLYRSAQDELNERRRVEADLRELTDTLEQRIAAEIERRANAEEALRQAQKMEAVGQLTGGIAHDFNNLLTVISGNIDMATRAIANAGDVSPRVTRALDGAQKGAQRAASLTQRLLAFARRQPLDPKPIRLDRLIRGISELIDRSLGERIEVEFVGAPGLWLVEVDAHELESAIMNLAVNARDAMPDGGRLTIELSNTRLDECYATRHAEVAPGQYVMLAISDTGMGMPPELLDKVFEPFFTTKEVGKGTGLGLSMVYGLVKQSGGHIKIYSEPDRGTTIKIYLPRLHGATSVVDEAAADTLEESDKEELILLVEDDEDVRVYTADCLRELGYRVLEAGSGEEAKKALDRTKDQIDLLFTDVVMPGITGEELAEELRRDRPDLKVLYTSGYTRDAIVHSGRLQPGVALLQKPFNFAELARKVRDVLELGNFGRTIVLVDEKRSHGPAREALGSSGYDVDIVHSERELRNKIRLMQGRYACAVLDDRSNQIDVRRTVGAVRSLNESLPILVLTDSWERLKDLQDRCTSIAPAVDRPADVTTLLRRLKVRCDRQKVTAD
ncbi:PAS domain-containing protein [Altererythrobacter aurantiacus]|uniref:histidine kinase n=1 Tax=Parapontixanthobacter aurantiacus TaxID=1463599 RepID=A0A844ZFC9_9SPHN|nr:PAS domain-containing protein [Parapontixanthobacter aurantiacus]MXO86013.1 PAS domain-containing protein [Parapontixanthobacter aurantiacus]